MIQKIRNIKPGYIRLGIDRKLYFEPEGLEKPEKPTLSLKWADEKTGCGAWICGYCKRELPATYIAYSKYWMGRKSCAGIARANYEKHLWACYNKLMKEYEASKRLVEIWNVFQGDIDEEWYHESDFILKNGRKCKAEVTGETCTIIELIK